MERAPHGSQPRPRGAALRAAGGPRDERSAPPAVSGPAMRGGDTTGLAVPSHCATGGTVRPPRGESVRRPDIIRVRVEYAKPVHALARVDAAGAALADAGATEADQEVVNNWRWSHQRPLVALRVTTERRVRDCDPNGYV